MSSKLAKYDPRVEGAALALLDKMHAALAAVTTVVDAKEIRTLATVAKDRALSLPAYNRAAALIFAAEVVIGQMLLKETAGRHTAQQGRPSKSPISSDLKVPTLQEILGARDTHTANYMAAAFRKLASLVTVVQLQAAEQLATKYNERLTRKSATMIVSGSWQKSSTSPVTKKITDSELWTGVNRSATALLSALQELKDRGSRVGDMLTHARAIAGALRAAKTAAKKG